MISILLKYILLLTTPITLFDSSISDNDSWIIVDDRVMGGVSQGTLEISLDGFLNFSGNVSTANYGGFSSARVNFKTIELEGNDVFQLRVKGDGKQYQFRVKSDRYQRHSYIGTFKTSKVWEIIEIPAKELYASFRGRTLSLPNYEAEVLEELAILIGNKRNESFQLQVDYIRIIKK